MRIENLDAYTGLKVIYLEGNGQSSSPRLLLLRAWNSLAIAGRAGPYMCGV